MAPVEPSGNSGSARPARTERTDLLAELARYLSGPDPILLVVHGAPGSGKSSLVRALVDRLARPPLLLAYRNWSPSSVPSSRSGHLAAVLMVDPEGTEFTPPTSLAALPTFSGEADARGDDPEARLPLDVALALERTAHHHGTLVLESWDRTTEAWFRHRLDSATEPEEFALPARSLHGLLARLPIPTMLVVPTALDAELASLADGIVELGSERLGAAQFRVMSVPKLRTQTALEASYVFSLEGGEFYCPPPMPPDPPEAGGTAEPDPDPEAGGLWPGSRAFAEAFGRLPQNSLSALQVTPGLRAEVAEVIALPLLVHALRCGGRVVYAPSASTPPGALWRRLSRHLGEDRLRAGLRLLAVGEAGPNEQPWTASMLTAGAAGPGAHSAAEGSAAPVRPVFEAAHQFLSAAAPGRPALFVVSFDGLKAIAAASRVRYDPSTFPVLVSAYQKIPGFCGLGIAAIGDPLAVSLDAGVRSLVRLEERYGRILVYGVRPPTPCYVLEWGAGADGYRLHRVG